MVGFLSLFLNLTLKKKQLKKLAFMSPPGVALKARILKYAVYLISSLTTYK